MHQCAILVAVAHALRKKSYMAEKISTLIGFRMVVHSHWTARGTFKLNVVCMFCSAGFFMLYT